MINPPRILLTAGEPAGVGPDLLVHLAQQIYPAELIAIADPDLLRERAQLLNLPLRLVEPDQAANKPGDLKIIPVGLTAKCIPGELNADNVAYVLDTLRLAGTLCLSQEASALVTGPVHKGIVNSANIPFTGHTEFFAELASVKRTVMLFIANSMRVALATTHVPLADVSKKLTSALLIETLEILHSELQSKFKIDRPCIALTGLNPHAGENGYLGSEEIETIEPVIAKLNQQSFNLIGPFAADTIFTSKQLPPFDALLAMYHDQALPVVKYASFGHAVNVTLGLPFVRTSVDHGTALEIAGTDKLDTGSMQAALALAIQLVRPA